MTIEINELFESRKSSLNSNGYSETRLFNYKGEGDPTAVVYQLSPDLGTAHPVLPRTVLRQIDVEPNDAVDVLSVTYTYGEPDPSPKKNMYDEAWSFEQTAQSQQINSVESGLEDPNVTSYQLVSFFDEGGNVQLLDESDMLQIGYNEGEATGIDVYRPYGALRVNKVYPLATVDLQFRQLLYASQNTVNDAAWQDWDADEVLFLGGSIAYDFKAQTAAVDYSFLFGQVKDVKFKVKKEFDNTLANITLANVSPFEYIWARYPKVEGSEKEKGNPAAGIELKRYPTHIYKTTVYQSSDFDLLGLVGPS